MTVGAISNSLHLIKCIEQYINEWCRIAENKHLTQISNKFFNAIWINGLIIRESCDSLIWTIPNLNIVFPYSDRFVFQRKSFSLEQTVVEKCWFDSKEFRIVPSIRCYFSIKLFLWVDSSNQFHFHLCKRFEIISIYSRSGTNILRNRDC